MKYLKLFEQFIDPFDPFGEELKPGSIPSQYGIWNPMPNGIGLLVGKNIINIEKGAHEGGDRLIFTTDEGIRYAMYHERDCCEDVTIDDINGDLDDLIGSPILRATEETNRDNPKNEWDESYLWTFYNISTIKGHVTIRWYGSSNGYYSEEVSFEAMD